jgi:hypothetical protein
VGVDDEDAGGADGDGVGEASGAAAGAVLVVADGVGTDGVAA